MPAVAAAIYLLLALRVRISLEGALCGTSGSLALSAGAAGVYIRFDSTIRKREDGLFFTPIPRYAVHTKKEGMKKERGKSLRIVKTYLWFAKTGRMERLSIRMRVGVGDAAGTAVAAGALRALFFSVLEHMDRGIQMDLQVAPDFEQPAFAAYGHCTFSCQPGDMMLAALRFALKERRNKGKAH